MTRRPVKIADKARLHAELRNMVDTGHGVLTLRIIFPEALFAAWHAGTMDDDMHADWKVAEQALKRFYAGSAGECLLCATVLSKPTLPRALVILRPELDAMRASNKSHSAVISCGICRECAALPDLAERCLTFYRKHAFPDLREVSVTDQEGHA